MVSGNCGYKLIIWLSVSTNHQEWLSTGVFFRAPVDSHFLRKGQRFIFTDKKSARYHANTANAKNIENSGGSFIVLMVYSLRRV